ncbi:ATP-dependent DNA helicase, RecQ family protein [Cryptosporidium felis]|nr:ATP-dependent DNA helicase, RecQ family protein [Cryptosporidium felis]
MDDATDTEDVQPPSSFESELSWYIESSEKIKEDLYSKLALNRDSDSNLHCVLENEPPFCRKVFFGESLSDFSSLSFIIQNVSARLSSRQNHESDMQMHVNPSTKHKPGKNSENVGSHAEKRERCHKLIQFETQDNGPNAAEETRNGLREEAVGSDCGSNLTELKESVFSTSAASKENLYSILNFQKDSGPLSKAKPRKNKTGKQSSRSEFDQVSRSKRRIQVNENDQDWEREDFEWSEEMRGINEQVFGNKSFRANQRQIMNAVISQRDVFVMMPTGGGKSLCFQLPGLLKSNNPASVTVVVMPLVALMVDQIEQLNVLGIRCASLNGSQSAQEVSEITSIIKEGSKDSCPSFLFVTPEKLKHSKILFSLLKHLNDDSRLLRFAIDEAHCVCQWGFDFRPDYTQLYKLREEFPNVPIIALTATATHSILNDVIKQLGMRSPVIFSLSFDRPNLRYEVRAKNGSKQKLLKEICEILKSPRFRNSTSIVYCLSRNECEEVSRDLNKEGISATFYHGSMKEDKRNLAQRRWMNDEKQVMVATIAFGMGINKKDVRLVIHLSMPKSLENYYQESGRAGRDGLESLCILYYSYKDVSRLQTLAGTGTEKPARRFNSWKDSKPNSSSTDGLLGMVRYCEEQYVCRRTMILSHFGENFADNCQTECDNCKRSRLERPVVVDVKAIAQQIFHSVRTHLQIQARASKTYGFLTLSSLAELLKGKKKSENPSKSLPKECIGLLKNGDIWRQGNVQRLLHLFITNRLFSEDLVQLRNGVSVASLKIGKNAEHRDICELDFDCFRKFQLESSHPSPISLIDAGVGKALERPLSSPFPPRSPSSPAFDLPRQSEPTKGVKDRKKRQFSNSSNNSPIAAKKRQASSPQPQLLDDNKRLKDFRNQLLFLRRTLASEFGISNTNSIASKEAIDALVASLPLSLEALQALPGWGAKQKVERFGLRFVAKVREFVDSRSISNLGLPMDEDYACPIDLLNPEDLDKELDLIGL